MILGIDEVGRGPWAGPLVVGAVVLGGSAIPGLTDSKKISKKIRETLDVAIRQSAAAWALGWVSAKELDEIGMSEALRLATQRAVEQIRVPYHEIIIDGTVNLLAGTRKGEYVTTMPKADLLVPSVSAASIIAKVARDNYMAQQAEIYPEYGFAANAGYGVKTHREAIERIGVCPLHRLSFAPLAVYRDAEPPVDSEVNEAMVARPSTRVIGNASESAACAHLESLGYTIVERNWKTKWCEIDIVARHDSTLYFVEVKHRKNDHSGDGLVAITPKKLRQMTFAAKLYLTNYPQYDGLLAVVSTTGDPPVVKEYLELK